MLRAILMACLIALVFGCAARKAQETKEVPWLGDSGIAPPALGQPNTPAAKGSAAAPAPAVPAPITTPTDDATTGKLVPLAEMSDSTPGAASVLRQPCQFPNCGVVLAIG